MKLTTTLALVLLASAPVSAQDKGLQKEWAAGKAAYESKDKKLNPKCKVSEDSLTLTNRGIAVTKKEYKDGVEISFTWKHESEDEGSYRDVLTVALWTTGEQAKWPSEVAQGYCVRFDPIAGEIKIEDRTSGTQTRQLEVKENVTMDAGKEYPVRIIARNNGEVEVTFNKTTTLSTKVDKHADGRVAIYNRESGGAVVKTSTLTKVTLKDLKK